MSGSTTLDQDRIEAIKALVADLDEIRQKMELLKKRRAEIHAEYVKEMSRLSKEEEALITREDLAQDAIKNFALGKVLTYSK